MMWFLRSLLSMKFSDASYDALRHSISDFSQGHSVPRVIHPHLGHPAKADHTDLSYRALLLSHSHIQAFSAASCGRAWLSASGPQESLEREALCLVIGLQSLCSQGQRAGKWPCLDDVDRMIMSGISAVVKMTAGNSSCFSTSTSISPVTGCSQEACGRPLVYFGLWDTGRGVHLAPAEQL